jgi:hypothetical protein
MRGRADFTPRAANLASRKTVPLWQLSERTNIRTPAAKTAERCVKLVVDQFAIVKTPGLVESVRLNIVASVRHLAAVPRISEKKMSFLFSFFAAFLRSPRSCCALRF